ncbi:hypothetical protein ASN18_2661 [Candidatus Magnetominusculus xianensis]|uniref:Terminase large subunit gp17-like C-terminal domain-containing protein n=2 Tax=Candidatus Magnetominusculus xianensis TaxID=1748249 RepID=A0ABR5SE38_9BACT|nr:hypothetical protein ASN18_2661 [Candidatus Magnetominusculus xianensis]MBF0402985.1 phage terminase large subunit [Nitrospirota bacterium]
MRLTMKEKQTITKVAAERYQKARKKRKGAILNEFTESTGYDRCYASEAAWEENSGISEEKYSNRCKAGSKRRSDYDEKVLSALKKTWYIMDCICGKRLSPILKEVIQGIDEDRPERHGVYRDRDDIALRRSTCESIEKARLAGTEFKSVLRYSTSKRWEYWERIFTDVTEDKRTSESMADAYFRTYRTEMLEGAEVLWPEVEDYYYLMKMRVAEGPAYFDSEKQNEPVNPDDCLFQEGWIQYYDDEEEPKDVPVFGVVDPSMGKRSKRHDPSAIVGGRIKSGVIYITIADIDRRHPDKIIEDILSYHNRERFQGFGVETIAFQEFFSNTLEQEAHRRSLTLNVIEIKPSTDKRLRIQTLQPWIKNGWIRFRRNQIVLVNQLKHYPMADHDDGLDALEMLKSLIESGTGAIRYESVQRRQTVFASKKTAY